VVFQRPDHQSRFAPIELAPGMAPEEVAGKTTANMLFTAMSGFRN
jgi:hypothetical protein